MDVLIRHWIIFGFHRSITGNCTTDLITHDKQNRRYSIKRHGRQCRCKATSTLNCQNRNSVFCDKSATFMKHLCNLCFLQLYRVPSPVDRDHKVSVLLQVALPADWSQRSVRTRKWSKEETSNLIFIRLLNAGLTQKAPCFFILIFFMRGV